MLGGLSLAASKKGREEGQHKLCTSAMWEPGADGAQREREKARVGEERKG